MEVHPRDRRRHPRFLLPSMYTAVALRPLDRDKYQWEGHAYDISEGGMRFEIDQPIAPGTPVAARIQLPGAGTLRIAERRPVYVLGNVVWLEEDDIDQPGPVRMALVFTRFLQPGDKERLLNRLHSGRFSLAA